MNDPKNLGATELNSKPKKQVPPGASYRIGAALIYFFLSLACTSQSVVGKIYPEILDIDKSNYVIIRGLVMMLGAGIVGPIIFYFQPVFLRHFGKAKDDKQP